ncbi:TPA: rhodanese-like domain-containing protein [Candidatus Woesearchaeota archaeon]|nr:rhodanese-like domain-containing protein [Candidatus Woesearchaeota archaeon]HIJ18310.1 rhodanese-like domain-containing protein [Candidatus Woesearchaeota archaeon]
MREEAPFCRYCQDPLPPSASPVKCQTCKRTSVPLTEKGISITPKEVKAKQDRKEDFLFIDVRWPQEREAASIKGTLFIPLRELEARLEELPKGKEIIIHCHTGGRSRFAAIMMRCNGFAKSKSMAGGIREWSREINPSVPQY